VHQLAAFGTVSMRVSSLIRRACSSLLRLPELGSLSSAYTLYAGLTETVPRPRPVRSYIPSRGRSLDDSAFRADRAPLLAHQHHCRLDCSPAMCQFSSTHLPHFPPLPGTAPCWPPEYPAADDHDIGARRQHLVGRPARPRLHRLFEATVVSPRQQPPRHTPRKRWFPGHLSIPFRPGFPLFYCKDVTMQMLPF